ncbi:MAG: ABC transporter ATP-binding protein [Acidimicrobiales bacterium]
MRTNTATSSPTQPTQATAGLDQPQRPTWVPIVSARGVHKTHRSGRIETPVLRGVDVDLESGAFTVILGASGSGKSTLLNCLSGLDSIDAGEIRIDDVDLHRLGDRRRTVLRAQRMGFVFQGFNLLPVLTARENVELPALATQRSTSTTRARAEQLLATVGLGDRADHRPAELSGGQQQRVAIARALMTDPAIIWADEPTGNLDRAAAENVLEIFAGLRAHGRTVVMVTHDPAIAATADRQVTVADGRVVTAEGAVR